ncbi:MAG: hypothetical protein ACKVWR_15120 [Acidimicrobiales bacterium]
MDTTPHVSLRLIETADRLAHGWPIGSSFVEEFWLPVMGPSCVAVLRWIDRRADHLGRATTVDLAELALAIGLGASTSKHSPIVRTLDRLVRFDAARIDTIDGAAPVLSVFTHLLAVPARLVARLPYRLQVEHRRAVTALAGKA